MGLRHRTIIDALLAHAAEAPDRPFIAFEAGPLEETWTFADAHRRAARAAAALAARGLTAGDRLVIVGGNDPKTVTLLLGAMGSGIVPAIVHPPLRADVKAARAQMAGVVGRAEPKLVVAPEPMHEALPEGTPVANAESVLADGDHEAELVAPVPEDLAYLQFSSGTTGAQKAVMISAGALAHNAAVTSSEAGGQAEDCWAIWLPLYHDMGLMSGLLLPLYHGHRVVLLPAERFVERPMLWLETIARHRATTTVAPNFAYALTARRARPEKVTGLDLSSLRVAYNGAEMVNAESVRRFEEALAPARLAPNTDNPVYGLAEFTLSAVFWRFGNPIRIDRVDRQALAQGRATPAADDERRVATLVSVGQVVAGHACRVVRDDGTTCGEREVGELQLRGPSRMLGYLGDEEQTAAAFDGDWLRTGDMGYAADGDLFICDRKKDIIIRYGENFFPQDLEAAAIGSPGIKPGRMAVFGVEDPAMATERVWLAFETAETGEAAYSAAQAVRRHVIDVAGFKLDGVAAVAAGWIEKTSSGKVRRYVCRGKLAAMYRDGEPPPSVGRWPL